MEWSCNFHDEISGPDGKCLADGSYINSDGWICYIRNKVYHNDSGPAVISTKPTSMRINGKVVVSPPRRWWYVDGVKHRLDGPAHEIDGGEPTWYVGGWCYETEEKYEEAKNIWIMDQAML